MTIKTLLVPIMLLTPAFTFAQRGGGHYQQTNRPAPIPFESSALSIYSENGEQFFLILNGVNQNNIPQSKIRVEGLPKYGNDVQIVFADNRTPAIRKNINIADPVDGKSVNMVLKITRGREGYPRLKFHRCTELDRNYHGPRDEYVMNYGVPKQLNTVTETTYTDPITGQIVTQTTTTTTDGYDNNYNNNYNNNQNYNNYNNNQNYNNNNYRNNNNNYTPPPPPPPMAMDPAAFADAKKSIAGASFEDTKLSTAKTIFASNYLNVSQVAEISNMFNFEDNKMAFVKFAYKRTVDPNNYFKLGSVFRFDANKQELNNFINSGGR